MRIFIAIKLCLALLLLSQSALAGYNVDVTKVSNWSEVSGKIAIAPAMCPADFDCVWLNETMAEYVTEGYPFTAGPQQVAQAMLEAGVESLDGEGAQQIAELLGVDSFLLVVVGNSESTVQSAVAFPAFNGGFVMAPSKRAQGGLEIRVVTSEGKTLARGSGFGESGWRKGRGVIGKVFGNLVDELVFE